MAIFQRSDAKTQTQKKKLNFNLDEDPKDVASKLLAAKKPADGGQTATTQMASHYSGPAKKLPAPSSGGSAQNQSNGTAQAQSFSSSQALTNQARLAVDPNNGAQMGQQIFDNSFYGKQVNEQKDARKAAEEADRQRMADETRKADEAEAALWAKERQTGIDYNGDGKLANKVMTQADLIQQAMNKLLGEVPDSAAARQATEANLEKARTEAIANTRASLGQTGQGKTGAAQAAMGEVSSAGARNTALGLQAFDQAQRAEEANRQAAAISLLNEQKAFDESVESNDEAKQADIDAQNASDFAAATDKRATRDLTWWTDTNTGPGTSSEPYVFNSKSEILSTIPADYQPIAKTDTVDGWVVYKDKKGNYYTVEA